MQALEDVLTERKLQDQKWGEQNHLPERWFVILMEELGEASRAYLESHPFRYRDEMVQVAAVALAAVEAFDRGVSGRVANRQ